MNNVESVNSIQTTFNELPTGKKGLVAKKEKEKRCWIDENYKCLQ
jgi:hypothetical protein